MLFPLLQTDPAEIILTLEGEYGNNTFKICSRQSKQDSQLLMLAHLYWNNIHFVTSFKIAEDGNEMDTVMFIITLKTEKLFFLWHLESLVIHIQKAAVTILF